jgi:hypothetical protein
VVRAAHLTSDNWDLELLALTVLERLAERLGATEFEKIVAVDDVLRVDPTAKTPQKTRVLDRLAEQISEDDGLIKSTPAQAKRFLNQLLKFT